MPRMDQAQESARKQAHPAPKQDPLAEVAADYNYRVAPHDVLSVSAVFWVLFVEALRLPIIRRQLERSSVALNRVFGVVLIAIGASTAVLK